MYLGKDIPVGCYQKDLKDARRSVTEQFLECFVQDQPITTGLESGVGVEAPTHITLETDELVHKFKDWQQAGGEFERSKSSISRELALNAIDGIKRIRPWKDVTTPDNVEPGCEQTYTVVRKQVPSYVFDLAKLRKRYGINTEEASSAEAEIESVDCDADIAVPGRRA
eukprot:3879826-Prymnesium_polylepis.2